MNKQLLVVFCLYTILFSFSTSLYAQTEQEAPIYIEANSMSATESSNSVIFSGDVDAKQADVRIRGDKMTVYYLETSAPKKNTDEKGKQEVDKLVCIGNVEITRGEWLGTGGKMVYTAKDRKIVLTQNAKAWQGQNMVTGSKITYYLDQKRSEVEGGSSDSKKPSRVNMTIIQK